MEKQLAVQFSEKKICNFFTLCLLQ